MASSLTRLRSGGVAGLDKGGPVLEAVPSVSLPESMKKLLPVLLVVAGGAAAYIVVTHKAPTYTAPVAEAQETIPLVLTSRPAAGETVRVFDVEGMCCGGCRPKVFAAVTKVAGVREAAVDVGTATVIVDEKVDVGALERAMTFEDYVAHARP